MKKIARPTRRRLLQLAAVPLLPGSKVALSAPAAANAPVRPGDPGWPSAQAWRELGSAVGGALMQVSSPWAVCAAAPTGAACTELFKRANNPYFLGDDVALTQTFGWVDAWRSSPSAYAVAARNTADVVAAVNFARRHRVRLVVKGGGHSYQGTSNAADSLLVWTRKMDDVRMHDAFVPQGCAGQVAPARAVSIGAGTLWSRAYDVVTTQNGGYVQGGGCMTVGVAGLVQSGGFGSFSKQFGLAAASLLEAEVVTADGAVRIANACQHPDLFWGLKGGGGGSLGVVTRLTLRVHALPQTFGAVNFTVHASSDAAFRRLVALVMDFYRRSLMNPHWGEQIRFRPGNVLSVSMVFQALDRGQAVDVWQPFLDALAAAPQDYALDFAPLKIVSTSARTFWSPTLFKKLLGFIASDDRPGAPEGNVFWPGDQGQAGQVLQAYHSRWLPAALLQDDRRAALCDALFAASRHGGVSLHFNKGLAGAPEAVRQAARETAMNPAVADAFALAISGANAPPAYPGIRGHEPDVALARQRAQKVAGVRDALRAVAPATGAYLAESDFFEPDWPQAFWGSNHERLLAVKNKYDPDRLFVVHHGP